MLLLILMLEWRDCDGEMGAEEDGTGETDTMRPGEEAAEGESRDTSRLLRHASDDALKLAGSTGDLFSPSSVAALLFCMLSEETDPERSLWIQASSCLRI